MYRTDCSCPRCRNGYKPEPDDSHLLWLGIGIGLLAFIVPLL